MKHYIILLLALFGTSSLFAQDTTKTSKTKSKEIQEYDTILVPKSKSRITFRNKKKVYRPTRLGSSSPLYDTYQRNDKGAGAVTTNPNKAAGQAAPVVTIPEPGLDSSVISPADSLRNVKNHDTNKVDERQNSKQNKKRSNKGRKSNNS